MIPNSIPAMTYCKIVFVLRNKPTLLEIPYATYHINNAVIGEVVRLLESLLSAYYDCSNSTCMTLVQADNAHQL
jgi:hypothetical protein